MKSEEENFHDIIRNFERRMEDILIDVLKVKGPQGILLNPYTGDVIHSFNVLMNELGVLYYSESFRIKPGDKHHEE